MKSGIKNLALALLVISFSLALFQVLYDFHKPVLKIWDEASSATNAVQMLINKSYLSVTVAEMPDKEYDTLPPLNIWTKVLSFKLFGVNEFSVRLQSILAALLVFLIFIKFSINHLKEYLFAIFFLLIVASTKGFNGYHVVRNGDPESLLILFTSIYFLSFFLLLEEYPKGRNKYLLLLGSSIFLATFSKSVAGIAPLAGIFVYALFQKKTYLLLKDYRFHITWLSVILLLATYYLIRNFYEPGYFQNSILRELSLYKSFPYDPKHPEATFYLTYLSKQAFFPYFYMLPLAIPAYFITQNKTIKRLLIYSFSASFFFILAHSSAITKNEWYIAPAYPFLWTLLALSLSIILHSLIENKFSLHVAVKYALIAILVGGLSTIYYLNFKDIFKENQAYKIWTYEPEREGNLLRKVKSKSTNHPDIVILSDQHPRQMLFYAKKYEFERGDRTVILKNISDTIIGKKVLVCRPPLKKAIDTLYNFQKLDGDYYGNLLFIESKKISPDK